MRAAAPPFRFRLIAALFLVLLWAACLDQASGPAGPATFDVLDGRTAPAVTQREIERALPSALRLQSGFTNELLALPGVVGTAVALGDDGLPTVAALVEHGGVSVPPGVRVIVTGRFSAFDWQAQPQGRPKCGKKKCKDPPDEPDPTERHPRPVPIGVSTGHPAITAGTIGARVTDGTDFWALSNNHVYAATNFNADDCTPNPPLYKCMPGDRVIQPGTFDDGALPRDKIGKVTDFEPLNISGACGTIDTNNPDLINIMDAAIAASTTALLGNATPRAGYGTPKSATIAADAVQLNMKVQKFGRTTGQTKGQVFAINANVNVSYGDDDNGADRVACFTGQIVISPGTFSAPGDSGALVVVDGKGRLRDDDKRPVGLLFAGSPSFTIISPIDPILARFGVTIDESAN